jgi:hypothetical protein
MHVRITIVSVKLVFEHVEGLKMEQRAVIKFCKKKIEENTYSNVCTVKNVYLEQVCLNGLKS